MILRTTIIVVLASLFLNCKGYREFREARKELQAEKAERKEQRAAQEAQSNPEPPSEKEERFPDSLFFAMKKTPCFGRCPTYEVRLYQGGYATYKGESNVEREGDFDATYSDALRDSIVAKAQRIGIMMLLDSYDNQLVTDLPSTYFQIQIGGQKKEVHCRIQCPERLVDFGKEVEEMILSIPWKRVKD